MLTQEAVMVARDDPAGPARHKQSTTAVSVTARSVTISITGRIVSCFKCLGGA
jgi:hypothetical protein